MNRNFFRTTFSWDQPFHTVHAGIIPWLLFLLSLGVYAATLQPWVLPGESASLAAMLVGATPDMTPYHFVWKNLMRLVAGSGDGMVFRLNLVNTFLGAGSVFFFYHVVIQLLAWVINPREMKNQRGLVSKKNYENAEHACLLGALSSSLVFAFAIPIWMCATRVYEHSFYLFWLSGSAYILLMFARSGRLPWLALWMALHTIGMTQTAAFIAFSPFYVIFFLIILQKNHKFRSKTAIKVALLSMIPSVAVLFGAAYLFVHSDGYALIGSSYGTLHYVQNMAKTLLHGTYGSLSQAPWLILIGLSVAPCLVSIVLARQALQGESSASYLLLHVIIIAIVILNVVECRISPWRFMGTSNMTVIPYLLIALTYAYAAAYLYLLPRNLRSHSHAMGRVLMVLRKIAPIVFLALPLWAAYANSMQAARCKTSIFRTYADRLLEGLDGRTWLATDSSLDTLLLIRAKERGQELHCVNPTRNSLSMACKTFTDESLRNATALGLTSLLQEWISHKDVAMRELALTRIPELWSLGGMETRPNKLVFLGETKEAWSHVDVAQTIAEHEALWKELTLELEPLQKLLHTKPIGKLPGDAPSRIVQFYVHRILIPQMSFVGNNLGFALSQLSQAEGTDEARRTELEKAAFSLYSKVHELDEGNLSATLNWARYIITHEPEEKQEEARKALQDIHENLSKNQITPQMIGAISHTFGFVEDPTFFAVLGWEWAQSSGRYEFAIQNLKNAQKNAPEHAKGHFNSNLARLHMAASNPVESEHYYKEILEEDPGNLDALTGLIQLSLNQGDTQKARDYVQQAKEAGGNATELQMTLAEISLVEGDNDRASALLQDIIQREPTNASAWSMLCIHWFKQKNIDQLSQAVKKVDEHMGSESYSALIAHGLQEQLKAIQDSNVSMETRLDILRTARDFYLQAFRVNPRNAVLWNRILEIDFQLTDQQSIRTHAMTFLRQDRNHPLANYFMGMLAIEKGENNSAEEYLRRAATFGGSIATLNDYAYLLCTLGKIEEAAATIHQAFQKPGADESDALWDTYGIILLKQGKFDDAENAFQVALSLRDDNPPIYLHLADLYAQKGNTEKAIEALRHVEPHAQNLSKEDTKLFQELQAKLLNPKK